MDRKSIGAFIAALRKANGMTQKDLAELLHVSDKTVSRWEVGDGAPDLALIPVIAEIFGVTCDELLRGERRPDAAADGTTPLGEKRRQWLLVRTRTRCLCINIAAAVVSVLGLLLMFVLGGTRLNFDYRVYFPLAFYAVSLSLQAVGLIQAFTALSGQERDPELLRFKGKLVFYTELFAVVTALCLCETLVIHFSAGEAWWFAAIMSLVVLWVLSLAINTVLRSRGMIYED